MSSLYRSPINSSGHIMTTPPRDLGTDGYKEALARGAIYDKIINVIAYDAAGNRLATIRSDYELIKKNGATFFKKMEIKPEISLSYIANAQTTVTQVNLTITNLFMYGANLSQSFYSMYRKIYRLEVFIGYYSDIADKSVFTIGEIPLGSEETRGTFLTSLEDYRNCSDCRGRMKLLTLTVTSINPTKPPPDSTTEFVCVIGSIPRLEDSLLPKITPTAEEMKYEPSRLADRIYVQELFERAITRVFFRQEWPLSIQNELVSNALERPEGLMSEEEGQEYGVRVYFTDKIIEEINDDLLATQGEQSVPYAATSAIASFTQLQTNLFPTAAMQTVDTGDILVYSTNEVYDNAEGESVGSYLMLNNLKEAYTTGDTEKDTESQKVIFGEFMPQGGEFVIPAIYAQSFSGVRTITMPFFKEVTTFAVLRFQSRYNVADLVDFYAGQSLGTESIMGFEMRVAFSTTGDENEIMLKGIRGD